MKMVNLNTLKDFTILYCHNKGLSISPLKLQKLLYYIQSWHIVYFEKDTLFEELPQAWVNGPVYRSVYDTFKTDFFKNDNFKITLGGGELITEITKTLESLDINTNQKDLIYAVLNNYGTMTDEKLVFLTHKEDPWNIARQGLSPIERSSNQITVNDIYDYYSKKINKG